MSVLDRLSRLRDAEPSDALLADVTALAEDARSEDEVLIRALARSIEARTARELGRHRRAVNASRAVAESWERFDPVLGEAGEQTARDLAWGLKSGAASALDCAEVPLATAEEMVLALDRALARFGCDGYAAEHLRARLSHERGDRSPLARYAERILPSLSREHWIAHHDECPACTVIELLDRLEPFAAPARFEEVVWPLLGESDVRLGGESASMATTYDLLGVTPACASGRIVGEALFARANARHGNIQQARWAIENALDAPEAARGDRRLRVKTIELEVATAERAPTACELAAGLEAIARESENTALRIDACVAVHGALAAFDTHSALRDAVRGDALTHAALLDARLPVPRHAARVDAALR